MYLCSAICPSHTEAPPDCSFNDIPANGPNENSLQSVVPETSSNSNDVGRCHELATNTSGDTVVPLKKFRGLGPQEVHEPGELFKMDWTERVICIKCNKGGRVLVCNESGCPIAIHQKCMGCLARFDDMGNFYCPYCLYKQALAETRDVREKAMLAKKALSTFIDKEMVDGNQHKGNTGMAKRKEQTPSTIPGNINCHDSERGLECNNVHSQSIQLEEEQQEEGFALICTTSTLQCKETTVSFNVSEPALQVYSKPNRGDETSDSVCRDTGTVSMLRRHVKQKDKNIIQSQKVDSSRRLNRKLSPELVTSSVKNEKSIICSKTWQLEDPSKLSKNSPCPNVRRKKWKSEEEEMLKEGVGKFSAIVNKNIPWRKILDFGRHVFDATRTPADLKDKWRNILAKERSTK